MIVATVRVRTLRTLAMNDKSLFEPRQVIEAPMFTPSMQSAHATVYCDRETTVAGKRRTIAALSLLAEAMFKKARIDHDQKYYDKGVALKAESKELKQSLFPRNKGVTE